MANAFLKPERLAATALGLLQREIVIPQLMTPYGIADFRGAFNDQVKVPIRARVDARDMAMRATGNDRNLTTDTLTESSVIVGLTNIVYVAIPVTDEEATLDVDDFAERVLAPQVRGVSEKLEVYGYNCIAGANYATTNQFTWTPLTSADDTTAGHTSAFAMAIRAGKLLDKQNVPQAGRVLLVGPDGWEQILTDPRLEPGIGASGLGEGALRDAVIGRFAAFTVVKSNLLGDDEIYAFHRSAYAFANVAPVVPQGAVKGHSIAANNFALRWVADYDAMSQTDRSVVTSYVGTKSIEDGVSGTKNVRAVKITIAGAGS
jgi:hypothetical protein